MTSMNIATHYTIVVPKVSSEKRLWLPIGLIGAGETITGKNFGLFDAPLWTFALLSSRLHWVWVAHFCGRLHSRISYSNTLGWNVFPIPPLSEMDMAEMTRRAEDIILSQEKYFPASLADLYDKNKMPEPLRNAHFLNDALIDCLYAGQGLNDDTERLKVLMTLYNKTKKDSGKAKYDA